MQGSEIRNPMTIYPSWVRNSAHSAVSQAKPNSPRSPYSPTFRVRPLCPRRRPATMSRLRLASWNLRYDVNPDDTPLDHSLAALPDPLLPPRTLPVGEQPWSARRVAVARTLFTAQVDLIGRCALLRSHVVLYAQQGSRKHSSDKCAMSQSSWVVITRGCVFPPRASHPSIYRCCCP